MWNNKRKKLEKRVANLESILPKLYTLIRKSHPSFPCEQFKQCVCKNCLNLSCIYHPNTTVESSAKQMIDEVLHI